MITGNFVCLSQTSRHRSFLFQLHFTSGSEQTNVRLHKTLQLKQLRSLTMGWFPQEPMSEMIARSSELNTLVLYGTFSAVMNDFQMFEGWSSSSHWEDLIKTQLPFLNKFEFDVSFHCFVSSEESVNSVLNAIIAPFCTSCFDHVFDSKMMTVSDSRALATVHELIVRQYRPFIDDGVSQRDHFCSVVYTDA